MKKIIAVFLILGLVFQGTVPLFAQDQQKTSIAIVDFQNTSKNEDLNYLQDAIPEMLITNLAKGGNLNIVERSRLEDAIEEMELGMSGLVDQSRAVEIGKAVGASAIMVGSYLEIGGLIRINARLIDVKSSKVLKAESVQGRSGSEIFNLMDQLASSIEEQLIGKPQDDKRTVEIQRIQQQKEQKPAAEKQEEKPLEPQEKEQVVPAEKGGGGNTALYILGGAALIGGGVAAAVLLGGQGDNGDEENPNSTVDVTVIIP